LELGELREVLEVISIKTEHRLQLLGGFLPLAVGKIEPHQFLADALLVRDDLQRFRVMRLGVIERLVPTLRFIHNSPGRDQQLEDFKALIRNMGAAGVPVLCYSWMSDDDWQRTSVDVLERGGAKVTVLDLARQTAVPNDTGYRAEVSEPNSAEQLWENLEYFLKEVVPVAERAGVKLSMHPDDPPVEELHGQARIMSTPQAFERLFGIVVSPSNGICLCQGTIASSAAGMTFPR
jgi:mannonate dehydratase